MKVSSASPGKFYERNEAGKPAKRYIVLAVHSAGQRQQSLQGLQSEISPGQALVAEVISRSLDNLGAYEVVPLDALTAQSGEWQPIPKRGAPITFLPGTAESAAERLSKSKSKLKLQGGARRSFNLTAAAVEALNKIRTAREVASSETLDDTRIINALLIEESERLSSSGKKA